MEGIVRVLVKIQGFKKLCVKLEIHKYTFSMYNTNRRGGGLSDCV